MKTLNKIPDKYFAEGIDYYYEGNELYFIMLTWREREILIFNKEYEIIKKIKLPDVMREGWGITHDPKKPNIFYISDSTNTIFECDYT